MQKEHFTCIAEVSVSGAMILICMSMQWQWRFLYRSKETHPVESLANGIQMSAPGDLKKNEPQQKWGCPAGTFLLQKKKKRHALRVSSFKVIIGALKTHLKIFYFIFTMCVCFCMCHACVWRSEDNLKQSVLSIHPVGPKSQVIKPGGKCLYPLSHFSAPD